MRRSSLRRRRGLLGVWSSKEAEVGSLSFASGVEVLIMSVFYFSLLYLGLHFRHTLCASIY